MTSFSQDSPLFEKLADLNKNEHNRLSPLATRSNQAIRRHKEPRIGYRQQFAVDADRILHSRAYTRYIDKTQVFCLVKNDHITHRVLHVQLVSRIARTIGRFLYLNEDLIESIALGHDIGHPPFGHDGEHFLSTICQQHGLPPFQHNVQSVRFLDRLEKKGRGWNLTVQTLDGILCHDGEVHSTGLRPETGLSFETFDKKMAAKEADPKYSSIPGTLEGCVVRLADTIAYIGRDIEDAITLGIIKRTDIPKVCSDILGQSNGTIIYTLVTDLISNSQVPAPHETLDNAEIRFSERCSEALRQLKIFNYKHIYLAPETKKNFTRIGECYQHLFAYYLTQLKKGCDPEELGVDLIQDTRLRPEEEQPEIMVRDFIAGMTDDFFLNQAALCGCDVPEPQ